MQTDPSTMEQRRRDRRGLPVIRSWPLGSSALVRSVVEGDGPLVAEIRACQRAGCHVVKARADIPRALRIVERDVHLLARLERRMILEDVRPGVLAGGGHRSGQHVAAGVV